MPSTKSRRRFDCGEAVRHRIGLSGDSWRPDSSESGRRRQPTVNTAKATTVEDGPLPARDCGGAGAEVSNGRAERSVSAVLAAAILLLLALPFAALGVYALNEVVVRRHVPGGSGGVFEVLFGSGVGLLIVAAIHVAAAASTWRGRSGPGSLAPLIGRAGLVLSVAALGLALFGAREVAPIVLLFGAAYGTVLVCLRGAGR